MKLVIGLAARCSSCAASPGIRAARPRPFGRRRRRRQRQRELRDVVRTGPAAGLQPRGRAAALVLVRAGDRGVRGGRRQGPILRDGPLGHCAQPLGQSVWRDSARRSRSSLGRAADSEGAGHRLADAARARVYRRGCRAAYRAPTPRRSARAPSRTNRRWSGSSRDNPWRHRSADLLRARGGSDRSRRPTRHMRSNLKAAAILEPLFKEHPKHPGLAHYIIHAYDTRRWPTRRWPRRAATRRSRPSVPHALHMPSHTFTRVGSWKESIETNRRSAEAARKENATGEELHAMDYQTYAYLQIAQDAEARRVPARHALRRNVSIRTRRAVPRPALRACSPRRPSPRATRSNAARGRKPPR